MRPNHGPAAPDHLHEIGRIVRRIMVLVCTAALAVMSAGCGALFDQMGMSADDQDLFEALMDDMAGGGGPGNGPSNSGGPGEAQRDPDWAPPEIGPPPGEPTASADYSDNSGCEYDRCGAGTYLGNDGDEIRDHYEGVFDRPADEILENDEGWTSSRWTDSDAEVAVSTESGPLGSDTDVYISVNR